MKVDTPLQVIRPKETRVKLVSMTEYPIATIYAEWHQSRYKDHVYTAEEYNRMALADPVLRADMDKVFTDVLQMRNPIIETVQFVFLLENCSVSLREQIVRHRIGHKFGEQLGMDMIPGGIDSTFWAQGMRHIDCTQFATLEEYYVPEPILNSKETIWDFGVEISLLEFYRRQMMWIQKAFKKLIEHGIPAEDARNLLPVGLTQRMTWSTNLMSLTHVLGKRSCWLAQLGMWKPVIHGMINELSERVHESFRRLLDPPCFKGGNWQGCPYDLENINRCNGTDPNVPCSLWKNKTEAGLEHPFPPGKELRYDEQRVEFSQLWGRNPETGEVLVA